MADLIGGLEAWSVAEYLRRSVWIYPVVNWLHIVAIGFLIVSAILMDLRILGLGRGIDAGVVIRHLRPVAAIALVVAVAAGFLLFAVKAGDYARNPVFLTKMGLLALAILNAALFTSFRAHRDSHSAGARAMAAFSILLWLSVALAGRLIAYFE